MEKVLTTLGNSVALVIDQPLCRLLGMRRGSRVRVTSDGQRLVIDPVPDEQHHEQPGQQKLRKQPQPVEFPFERIVETLVCWHISEDAIRALHPGIVGPRPHSELLVWASRFRPESPEIDQQYARRFRTCFEKVRTGSTWPAAVEETLNCA
jgi:antitoxin component of MazEF toxin-antitoxin module